MASKKHDINKNSDFVINYEKTEFLIQKAVDRNSITDFLVKHQMSSEATYSSKNCDNKILNHESTKTIKNKKLPNDNINKDDRRK